MTPEEWQHSREMARTPLDAIFSNGCSDREGDEKSNWRWCAHEGRLTIVNPAARARKVVMTMGVRTGYEEEASFQLEGDIKNASLKVTSQGTPYAAEFVVPPGRHTFKLRSDAKRVQAPGDPRVLVFRLDDFRLGERASKGAPPFP